MHELHEKKQIFLSFPEVHDVVDAMFQQGARSSGSLEERKLCFSGKH